MRLATLCFPFVLLLLPLIEAVYRSEEWGYVQVRPGAHMFWWLYKSPNRVHSPSTPWPVVLWLQGGPGASGVGIGNFEEIGPLDTALKPRNSTWLQSADLLFVDNPVGTGFSFVEEKKLVVQTDEEAGRDLTTLLKKLFNGNKALRRSPLYVVAESYGGKFAVTLGLTIVRAVRAGELKIILGGIALGNSWISPEDFVFSWPPLLKDVSRLDENGVMKSNRVAETIKQRIEKGEYKEATESWSHMEEVISSSSNSVDFYNFLRDSSSSDSSSVAAVTSSAIGSRVYKYSGYLSEQMVSLGGGGLEGLMNGVIKRKLRIIPQHVKWGGQADLVFEALSGDFMKPRIHEVDELLAGGVNITIYNGQLDVICATKGTESWLQKLKWEGLKRFNSLDRIPLYCASEAGTKAFRKSYENLRFYWILGAGHFVPVEQPCIALKMLQEITSSPVSIP